AAETRLQYLNQHDPLTGLYNRAHFLRVLEEALAGVKAGGAARALAYVALPLLHANGRPADPAAGERFLLLAARALNEVFGPGATLARLGDREFAALLDADQTDRLSALCEAAERALKQHAAEANVGASGDCRVAGVALDAGAQSAEAFLNALYAADAGPAGGASAGANAPGPAAPAAPAASSAEPAAVDWPARIRAALEHGAFRLLYQPIVHLHGDGGEFFEVLVRMVADDGTLIPAGQFMPPAEAAGLAAAIDRWVVRHAIRALAELRRQKRTVTFFINLSAAGLQDVELAVITQQALHETRLKGKYVVFELDEAALASHPAAALAFMRAAGQLGCSFCIDNFGRALDATQRLRESPIEYLKLDGALARGVARDPVAQASLKAVVEVAKSMAKKTIAKSVESAEALSVLWTFGIDYVQGHYFQEADSELRYDFAGETTLSSESSPEWAVASTGKSR
ncbi:MAG TPA: bifunctional diguanylate cyclase/phosphodiesterase, partial [Burkholderiales bacterium]